MCLFAETTSLYICLGLPRKDANDFQTSRLNSLSSCTSSFKPTETANQNLRLVHFSLSVSSLFLSFLISPSVFLLLCALAQIDILSCNSLLSCSDSSPPQMSVFSFWKKVLTEMFFLYVYVIYIYVVYIYICCICYMYRKNLKKTEKTHHFSHQSPKQGCQRCTHSPIV